MKKAASRWVDWIFCFLLPPVSWFQRRQEHDPSISIACIGLCKLYLCVILKGQRFKPRILPVHNMAAVRAPVLVPAIQSKQSMILRSAAFCIALRIWHMIIPRMPPPSNVSIASFLRLSFSLEKSLSLHGWDSALMRPSKTPSYTVRVQRSLESILILSFHLNTVNMLRYYVWMCMVPLACHIVLIPTLYMSNSISFSHSHWTILSHVSFTRYWLWETVIRETNRQISN